MRLVLLALLTLLPTAAHAGPVIAAIAVFMKTYAVYIAIAQVAFTIGMHVYSAKKLRKNERKAKEEFNANLKDQMTTRIGHNAALRYAYGETRVGSDVVAMFTSGDKDQYQHLVCVHAAHECESIEEVYINSKALGTLTGDGSVTSGDFYKEKVRQKKDVFDAEDGQVLTLSRSPSEVMWVYQHNTNPSSEDGIESRNFTVDGDEVTITDPAPENPATIIYVAVYHYIDPQPTVRVKKHLGTSADPADASLLAEVPSKWNANCLLSGLCYTVIRLDLNEPEFQRGPPSVEVLVRGAKLYDPRTELTEWSDNPALVAYHYLTSDMCGIPAADLPTAKFITAANVCDEVFSFGKRYTFNGAISADQSQGQVLEEMADAMAGNIVATTWDITAGKYVAPVMALTQDDIVGQWAVTPGSSEGDLFNGVRGEYLGADVANIVTEFKAYQNSTYLAADGRELWLDKTFPYTNNTQRVHNLCRIFVEQQRNSYTLKADFSQKAWKLKVDDRVTITSALFGWTDKIFVVLDKEFSPTSTVKLTLKEDAESIWDFADATVADSTENTNLPNPFAIAPIASLTCASGSDHLLLMGDGTIVSRMHVSWPAATTQAVLTNGTIEVEFQSPDEEAWRKAQVTGEETEVYLSPVKDGHPYTIRARTVNPYMNIKSEWYYATHTVVGKTEAPPDVTGFDVTQLADATRRFSFDTSNQPVDVTSGGGYRIKYRTAGSGTTWENMTLLHNGLVTASPYETMLPAAGTYDFAIAAVDSSGNESENAALDSTIVIVEDSDGSEALALLADIANDNILTKNEKPRLIAEVNELLDEFVENRVQADNFSVSRTNYDKTFWALYDYLGTLAPSYDNLAADTVIVGATLRQKFADLYLARQVMLNAISAKAKLLADTAQTTADTAVSNAADAQADADTANALLADIASDSKLTPVEKQQIKVEWDGIVAEKAGINAQATAFGITTENTNYNNAYDTLSSYITPLLSSLTTTSNITGSTFRSNFASLYAERQALLNKIAEAAGERSLWTGVSGSGKPADNAQVNAPGLGIKINQTTFSNSSNGEAYIHGFTSSGAAADVDGHIFYNGSKVTVPKGSFIDTNTVGLWYILFDMAGRDLWNGNSCSGASKVGDVWTWKSGGSTGTVTVDADIVVIGAVYMSGTELISHGEVWTEAIVPSVLKNIIDTVEIAENAVSIGTSAFTSGSVGIGASTTVQSLVYTSVGARVFLLFTCAVTNNGNAGTFTVNLKYDGASIQTYVFNIDAAGNPGDKVYVSLSLSHMPSAGSRTYSAVIEGNSNYDALTRSLIAIELKK